MGDLAFLGFFSDLPAWYWHLPHWFLVLLVDRRWTSGQLEVVHG